MTPDRRVFERLLPLIPNALIIDWIKPLPFESITSYASRLGSTINPIEPEVVCGVSFGGIVARELAPYLNAKSCVLISSIASPQQLPPWFRLCRIMKPRATMPILQTMGMLATLWPISLRSVATWRLAKLYGSSGDWYRWGATAVLNWKPSRDVERIPLTHIHGDRDRTFPLRYTKADIVIHGGGHVLTLTHSHQIAATLRRLSQPVADV